MGKPPPITRSDKGQGVRRNRLCRKALKMVQQNQIMPYWEPFVGHKSTRIALEEWQLAEFKAIRKTYDRQRQKWFCRLTDRGVKVRDDYARYRAELASKRKHGQ